MSTFQEMAVEIEEALLPKPVVKITGGKRKLIPEIRAVMPPKFDVYHEPFFGGGALYFDLLPEKAVLSDLNSKLITMYKALKDDVEAVIKRLKRYKNTPEFYYRIRKKNFDVGDNVERAADYIYMNKCGYNGMFRENKDGQFNIPYGKYDNPNFCDEINLRNVSHALKGVPVLCEDFMYRLNKGVRAPKKGDFCYIDPPYAPLSKTSNFTGFIAAGFGDNNQKDLRDAALKLKKKGVHVVLSNSNADLIRELYTRPEFTITEVQAARNVNSDGGGRGKITELLIY
jgi:DNA adenine methylase